MALKVQCPFGGRQLSVRKDSGPMTTCDGCDGRFNLGKLVHRPASVVRQIIGWIMVVVGGLVDQSWLAKLPPVLADRLQGILATPDS